MSLSIIIKLLRREMDIHQREKIDVMKNMTV